MTLNTIFNGGNSCFCQQTTDHQWIISETTCAAALEGTSPTIYNPLNVDTTPGTYESECSSLNQLR